MIITISGEIFSRSEVTNKKSMLIKFASIAFDYLSLTTFVLADNVYFFIAFYYIHIHSATAQ